MSLDDFLDAGAFPALFAGIPMPKAPTDAEQHAPFTAPTPAEVEAMREGIEAHKRRNAEATPPRAWHSEPHGEL